MAREFRIRYPYMFLAYKQVCARGELNPGEIHYYYSRDDGKTIYSFATKNHWRDPSQLEWIDTGLTRLRKYILLDSVKTIAIPPLGCGLGGLDWVDVEPLIHQHLADLAGLGCRVTVYPPEQWEPYNL